MLPAVAGMPAALLPPPDQIQDAVCDTERNLGFVSSRGMLYPPCMVRVVAELLVKHTEGLSRAGVLGILQSQVTLLFALKMSSCLPRWGEIIEKVTVVFSPMQWKEISSICELSGSSQLGLLGNFQDHCREDNRSSMQSVPLCVVTNHESAVQIPLPWKFSPWWFKRKCNMHHCWSGLHFSVNDLTSLSSQLVFGNCRLWWCSKKVVSQTAQWCSALPFLCFWHCVLHANSNHLLG